MPINAARIKILIEQRLDEAGGREPIRNLVGEPNRDKNRVIGEEIVALGIAEHSLVGDPNHPADVRFDGCPCDRNFERCV